MSDLRRLTVEAGAFLRGGRPHQIISGGIHYFRVHPDLWLDRLTRMRAMGLNTVETYLPWNVHERRRGEPDFTGPRDVARFVDLADSLGLDVILRPGPYICAEWDFGGLPAWLMATPTGLRTSDPAYLAEVDRWYDAVCAVMRPLLAGNGGPVVAVQVENEYGSYGADAAYLEHCRSALVDRDIDVLLCTSDGPGPDWLAHGTLPGVLATVNFGSRVEESYTELRKFQPEGPDMCMEFWNGWFDHWGEHHHVRDEQEAARTLDEMLRRGASVNFYMAHGGTNFGLWNGANDADGQFQPTVTSYDYDAPIGEAGELRQKFHAYRDVIAKYVETPAELPDDNPVLPPQQASVAATVALLDVLDLFDPPVVSPHPLTMEELGQDHGLVLYRGTGLVPPDGRTLELDGLADRAVVLVDSEVLGIVDRNDRGHAIPLTPRPDGRPSEFYIVVENQGRINYGPLLGERKGLRGIRIAQRYVHGWESTALRIDTEGLVERLPFGSATSSGPVFARTTLRIEQPADGFLALPGWGKGFLWLNGTLLGRYWERGPQVTLYAPGPLWRTGDNDLVVLELERPGSVVDLRSKPDLGPTT